MKTDFETFVSERMDLKEFLEVFPGISRDTPLKLLERMIENHLNSGWNAVLEYIAVSDLNIERICDNEYEDSFSNFYNQVKDMSYYEAWSFMQELYDSEYL